MLHLPNILKRATYPECSEGVCMKMQIYPLKAAQARWASTLGPAPLVEFAGGIAT